MITSRFGQALYGDVPGLARNDAPVGIIFTVGRRPLQSALVDAGLFLQALMLAARGAGLALGYADEAHRLNHQHTPREPTGSFATFYE